MSTEQSTLERLEDRVDELEETVEASIQDKNGQRVTLGSLLELGLTRRQALGAIGLVASGATVSGAVLNSIGSARGQEGGNSITGIDQLGEENNRIGTIYAQNIDTDTFTQSTDAISADSISTDALNSADLAAASSGTVPTAQGDGTLAMSEPSGSGGMGWNLLEEHTDRILDGESVVLGDNIGDSAAYRLIFTVAATASSTEMQLRFNEISDADYQSVVAMETALRRDTNQTEILVVDANAGTDVTGDYTIASGSREPTIHGDSATIPASRDTLMKGGFGQEVAINSIEVMASGGELAFDSDPEYKLEIWGRGSGN